MEDETATTTRENQTSDSDQNASDTQNDQMTANFDASGCGGSNGARYKLIAPAKLPISRSGSITIPPGLSPTSFLESPVLLSNMKAEPSPTTGSFSKSQLMHGFVGSAAFLSNASYSNTNTYDERKSSFFDFKPTKRSVPGLPSVRPLVSADLNHHQNERVAQVPQSFASSPLVKNEVAASSTELYLSANVHMTPSKASPLAEADSDELDQRGHPNTGVESSQSDHKGNGPSVIADRPSSDDGYNWRKYGQKHVKGSEYPRSYYKCTHPNCEVKKLFERSHDGQITEIIYKGTHDHPKPQPSRRSSAGSTMFFQEERHDKPSSLPVRDDNSSNTYRQIAYNIEANGSPELSPITTNVDSVEGSQMNRINDEVDDDDPFSKRRRMDCGGVDVTPVLKPIREPRVVVQTLSEVDILDDGYRWRKYGQKVVRGNPNPRSYYKCTNTGCPVRKHVERASHDPKAVITTYEGKHNHDVPTAKTNSHDTAGPMPARVASEENDRISLDLGVGMMMSSASENRPSNDGGLVQSQMHGNGLIYFNGSRENHSSYAYSQSMGRVVMGP